MESALRARVTEVVPRIREEAARTEAERRIPTEVLAALMDAGLFALAPEPDPDARTGDLLDVVHDVAGACGSTGWVTAHAAGAARLVGLFPAELRARLRSDAEGVDPLIAFSLDPGGRVTERDGALRLDGSWSSVTGVAHATWLVLAARRSTPDGPGAIGLVVVPAAGCTLAPAVDSIGLAAAGAHEVTASDVVLGDDAWTAPSHDARSRLESIGTLVAMALVGAAQGALREHVAQVRRRVELSHGGEDVSVAGLSPARIGRAASQLDAAELVLRDRTADPDGLPQDRIEQQHFAIEHAVEGTELAFGSVRGHALDNGDPVARLWRDVLVGAHHARALTGWLRTLGS